MQHDDINREGLTPRSKGYIYDKERGVVPIDELVDWENPPSIDDLKADISSAMSAHSAHKTKVDDWLRLMDGRLKIQPVKGRSKIQPKLVRKQAEWQYASMEEPFLSTQDMFKVSPATALDKDAAWQNQLILNKQFRVDIPKVRFINKYIHTAVDTGTVILKLGWKVEMGIVREQVEQPVYASPEESMMMLQQAVQQGQMDPNQAQQMLQSGEPMQVGTQMVEQEVEKEIVNSPVVEVKDSRSIIIDPSCEGDIDKAQFIVDRFITDLSTLKKDGRYKNLEAIRPSDYAPSSEADFYDKDTSDGGFSFKDKPRQKLVVNEYWGYWDIHNDGVTKPIVASFVGDIMIRLEENPFPDKKFPFVIVQFLPVTGSVYGEPNAALLEDNQDIIGALMRGTLDLMGRSANSQIGIRKDALDSLELIKFKEGKDYQFNPHVTPEQAMYMHKFPEIPKSAIDLMMLQNTEAESMTGVRPFNASNVNASTAMNTTATGIRSAMDASAKKEISILRRLSQGLIDVGKKIMAMNSVWLSDEEIIRITDEEFVAIKRDDLAGNFDLSLDVSTAEADNEKAQELAFMLQTTGNSMPFDVTKMILVEIARLRKMPDLAQAMKEYEPQPDPLQVRAQELQVALLEAQVRNESAKGAENEADVTLKANKASVEAAKARKLNSDSDLQDLNYIEQSMGINQERDLEKMAQQEEQRRATAYQSEQERRITELAKIAAQPKDKLQGKANGKRI